MDFQQENLNMIEQSKILRVDFNLFDLKYI